MRHDRESFKTIDVADIKHTEPPRLRRAERRQIELRACDLESLLPEDHRARLVWEAVEQLDLSDFYAAVSTRLDTPGRPATDPKILLALWVYATSEAVGSARHLERLCTRDHAYIWLCGGVTVNRTMLAEFRVDHGDKLDALLTKLLAVLMNQGLLSLRRVAQDGVRVRASAGASSFRRRTTLEQHLQQAKDQVQTLKRELDDDPASSTSREKKSRERALARRKAKLERALAEMPKVEEAKARNPPKKGKRGTEARVSTTDPEARVMKMGDGGWRPAYNIQFATDTESRFIVGVDVLNVGSDGGQLLPMLDQLKARTGESPQDYLADGSYAKLSDVHALEHQGIRVFAPVPTPRREGVDRYARKNGDTELVAAWRARMGTEDAKKIYVERGATIETVNADLRAHRGLQQLPVRGRNKVKALALLHALTFNLLRLPRALLAAPV